MVTASSVFCDRGMIPLSAVSVYGPGQKAILAWNGYEEVMILSTDMYADRETAILEVLPLPSSPDLINKTDFTPFEKVQELLIGYRTLGTGEKTGRSKGGDGVEIIFHEKIGSHDVTVIRVSDMDDFEVWANRYLEDSGVSGTVSSEDLSGLVQVYISDGYPYFVLDLVQASTEPRSIEPLLYRFKSDELYFPLRISAMASGDVDISLFAITSNPIFDNDLPSILSIPRFSGPLNRPVRLKVLESDLEEIHPLVGELFEGDVWMCAIEYQGSLKGLGEDLAIPETETLIGEALVSSAFFWLGSGVILGALLGIVIARLNMDVLGIQFKRIVSAVDFLIVFLLLILSSVMAYTWSAYVFWLLVPVCIATLYYTIRIGDRRILFIYIALPLLGLVLVFSLLYAHLLEIVVAFVLFMSVLFAAAFPPEGRRALSEAFRRSSRWVSKSRRRGRI